MQHDISLLTTIAVAGGLAFLLGLLAARVRLPPIVGYLLAGVLVGPHTPGWDADPQIASQLAELGVILLMFGVGLHFSLKDLLAVRRIAVPGAIAQISVTTVLGAMVARLWDQPWQTALVFGLTLSVASTVVLVRTLEDRGIIESADGRIAVGWLIVQDIVTVLVLVMLPALAGMAGARAGGGEAIAVALAWTVGKVVVFTAVMIVVGGRAIPWLLGWVVYTGSRELFTLAVLVCSLGIAVGASLLFDVSFALGAFLAGLIVSESDFSHEAASNALPLQDAFAVLFFVSVGMLFDPAILAQEPLAVVAVVAIVLFGTSATAFTIAVAFRYSIHTALTLAASLAQIGEFSFILAALGVSLGLLPLDAQSLVVAGAILTITLNPFVFRLVDPAAAWIRARRGLAEAIERPAGPLAELPPGVDPDSLRDHVVLVGYGRVGAPVADELALHRIPYVIIEQSRERAEELRKRGLPVLAGDATRPEVLEPARLDRARMVLVAAPDAYEARAILELARRLNPGVDVLVRTHSDPEREFLESHGAARALVAERELAVSLTRAALRRYGVPHDMEQVARRALHLPT